MRRIGLMLLVLLVPAAGHATDVRSFLDRAHVLQQKNMLVALMSPDFRLLKDEVVAAGHAWRAQLGTARPPVCAPPHIALNRDQVLAILQAVPVAQQPLISVQDALVRAENDRYRCR